MDDHDGNKSTLTVRYLAQLPAEAEYLETIKNKGYMLLNNFSSAVLLVDEPYKERITYRNQIKVAGSAVLLLCWSRRLPFSAQNLVHVVHELLDKLRRCTIKLSIMSFY